MKKITLNILYGVVVGMLALGVLGTIAASFRSAQNLFGNWGFWRLALPLIFTGLYLNVRIGAEDDK
jgi:hypothetical protein